MEYARKPMENNPVLAICYDFDKTLTPDDMQAQGYIQSVGYDVEQFWEETNTMAHEHGMDSNLAYMYKMVQEAEGNLILNRKSLMEYGSQVKVFPGVEDWFERIRAFGEEHGVCVEHYIISSGLQEMIEGTGIAKWPAQVVNYTNKTQFLFRIEKGTLDVNDPAVNEYFPPDQIRVPFRNMVYIGDSDTDIPCMKLVNANGGHSIGVYNPETGKKDKVQKMIRDHRIRYYTPADYRDGSELDTLIKQIVLRTAENEKLEAKHLMCCFESESVNE